MPAKLGDFGAWSKEDLEAYAKEHLNEDPKRTPNDIKAIKDWIKKQPHLNKNVRTGREIQKFDVIRNEDGNFLSQMMT